MSAAEQTMDKRYRGWTRDRRMKAAVQHVIEDGWSQSEAARRLGVSRSRVNINVNKHREKMGELAARSDAALAERVRALEGGVVEPEPELAPSPQEDGQARSGSASSPSDDARESSDVTHETQPPITELRRIQPADVFMRDYFSGIVCPDCGVHHEVPWFHDEMITKITDPATRRLLVNVAPYHAKSTIGTVYSTIYEISRDPNSRTAIVSKAERLAKNFLFQIKKFLTDPTLYENTPRNLIEDWGPFHNPNNWSATDIFVAGRSSSEKDPTVSVYGVGAQIYGYRFDRMLFDDIADLENQRNADRVQEMLQWATLECASRVGKTGKLIFVGTRIMPGDIYSYLQDLPAYEVFRYPCITDEEEQTTLWQEHFPYSSAAEQRASMSIEQFQLVYQNVDTLGAGAAFPMDVLDATKDSQRFMGHWLPEWRLVLGVDPAGAGEQAGYTAMVVLAVDLVSGQRFIVDMVNQKQMRAPQIKDQIIDFADKYPLSQIVVETNGLQMVPVDTPVWTPTGFRPIGELELGDRIAARDGSWTKVRAVSDRSVEQMFELRFSDGSSLESHAGHRWLVQPVTKGGRTLDEQFFTTQELIDRWDEFKRFRVRRPEPLEGDEQDLPLDPYVFGAWLGDGTVGMAQFTQDDSGSDMDELRAAIELAGYPTRLQSGRNRFGALGMLPDLRATGAFHDKHVPEIYLRGSFKQRLALLQGLMDTDGTITGEHGHAVFYNTNPALIEAVEFLLRSLGYRPSPARWHTHDREVPIGAIKFYPNTDLPNPFRMTRKAERVKARTNDRSKWLTIRSIEPSREAEGVCIQVEHPDEVFLAGHELVPTGNSQIFQYDMELISKLTARGIRFVPHITHGKSGRGGKWDDQFGVESMGPMFYNRQISCPYADINSRRKTGELFEQLSAFPMGTVTDLVMALWFADLGCREIFQRAKLPAFDSRAKIPRRIQNKRHVVDFGQGVVRAPTVDEISDPTQKPESRRLVNVAGDVTVWG